MKLICFLLFFIHYSSTFSQKHSVKLKTKPTKDIMSLDKTIYYLNDFSRNNPEHGAWPSGGNFGSNCKVNDLYFQFSVKEEGMIWIQQYLIHSECINPEKNRVLTMRLDKFYAKDVEKIYLDDNINLPSIKISGFRMYTASIYSSDISSLRVIYNGILNLIDLGKKEKPSTNFEDPFLSTSAKNAYEEKIKEQRIPIKNENGVFILTLNIGGINKKFILDSGASDCSISSDLEEMLLQRGVITSKDYLPNGKYQMANGTIIETRRLKIPKITIGTKVISNTIVSVGSLISPNLLGQSFLKNLKKWSIDNASEVLIFQ